ncbi:PREDICTED: uncharacterized protein LOC107186239 [Dufourea novaeangliae]|uniref:uncharacterized protein LOC107186239 n=1 Tax=Dufourea novaeangliae TaxID=178035 RepID=UPI00076789F8|nr:PREDICTED: uncharacterized protein LOC107186239 [Dufourea novaeangliae]
MEDYNDYDIIIIGGGLSGLICAYNILKRKAGLEVLIIEANKEVGGRILPDYSDTYYASSLQEHITDLTNQFHVITNEGENIDVKKRILYTKYGPSKKLPRFYGAEVHHFLQLVEKNSLDPRFNSYTKHEDAKHLAETSVAQLLRRLNGMIKIVHVLLNEILRLGGKIRYVEPVKKVRFNDDRAYVETAKNRFKCELAVLAVPPPIENIIIESPPEYLLNTHNLYASGENTVFKIAYRIPLWNDHAKDIVTTWDLNSNLNIAYDATHTGTNAFVLSGFLAQSNSSAPHTEELFETLNKCFDTTEAEKYIQFKVWNPDLSDEQGMISSPMSVMKPTSIVNHTRHTNTSNGRKSRRTKQQTFFKLHAIQYLGLALNAAVFFSFLNAAYNHN